jgi:hypothetical protein
MPSFDVIKRNWSRSRLLRNSDYLQKNNNKKKTAPNLSTSPSPETATLPPRILSHLRHVMFADIMHGVSMTRAGGRSPTTARQSWIMAVKIPGKNRKRLAEPIYGRFDLPGIGRIFCPRSKQTSIRHAHWSKHAIGPKPESSRHTYYINLVLSISLKKNEPQPKSI